MFGGVTAQAGDEVDVRIVIKDVKAGDAPLYLSIQSKEDYRSQRAAASLIVKSQTGKPIDKTFKVPSGDYAISVWHDLDKDNSFSMNEKWEPLDGWASSGPELKGDPTFDEVKLNIVQNGQVAELSMNYSTL